MGNNTLDSLDAAVLAESGITRTAPESIAEAYSMWVPVHLVKLALHGIADERCLCGCRLHRAAFIVANRGTGELLGPVGSECVRRFGAADAVKRLEALARLEEQNVYSRHFGKELPVRTAECNVERAVTQDAIDGLLAIGALEPAPGDGFPELDADAAHKLLTDVFHKYKTGFSLRPKAHELMERRVRGRFEAWCEEGVEALLSLMRAAA